MLRERQIRRNLAMPKIKRQKSDKSKNNKIFADRNTKCQTAIDL